MVKPSTHPVRVFLALLIAPFVGCVLGLWIVSVMNGDDVSFYELPELAKTAMWVWLYSLPLSVPLGGLVHLALLKFRLWPVTAYTLIGLLLGPVALLIWLTVIGTSFIQLNATLAWLGAITGGLTALTFRLLVHRADDSPSSPPAGTRPY